MAAALVEHSRYPQAPGREIDLSATEAMLRLLETLPAEFEQLGVVRPQRARAVELICWASTFDDCFGSFPRCWR